MSVLANNFETLEEQRALYPRVSDIIGKQNADELRSVPIDTLYNACIRGTKVHEYCTAFAKSLWIPDIESEYKPYVESFEEWSAKYVESYDRLSERLYDDERMFTGEFDMIVNLKDGRRALIDIKTSSAKSKSWPIQLAAYAHLCKLYGYEFDVVLNLHLKKTQAALYEEKEGEKLLVSPLKAKACEIMYDDLKPYWEIFSSSLKCYDYFCRKGGK